MRLFYVTSKPELILGLNGSLNDAAGAAVLTCEAGLIFRTGNKPLMSLSFLPNRLGTSC